MRITRIYHPTPIDLGSAITLTPSASNHLTKVLRLTQGHPLILFNGDGHNYQAEIASIAKLVTVNIISVENNNLESPVKIHLGQVISRGEKMDFTIQKAVELGITQITPLRSERCNVKLDKQRQPKKIQHWQGIIESACEQSGRSIVPTCNVITNISAWIETLDVDLKIILEPTGAVSLNQLPSDNVKTIAILVGPEGGFSTPELELAIKYNFKPVVLGPRILRTETAGLTLLSLLQYCYGDFR